MSTTPKDGGPAFPTKREALDPRSIGWSMQDGMSLRDWFAGMALQSILAPTLSDGARHRVNADKVMEQAVRAAWIAADAMLAAREEAQP